MSERKKIRQVYLDEKTEILKSPSENSIFYNEKWKFGKYVDGNWNNLYICDGIKTIDKNFFDEIKNRDDEFENIFIPNSVEEIHSSYSSCRNFHIGKGVNKISKKTLYQNLNFSVDDENQYYEIVDSVLYEKNSS